MDDMNKKLYRWIRWTGIFSLLVLLLISFLYYVRQDPISPEASRQLDLDGVRVLGQGWTPEERQQVSYTSFGSQILNYQWFIAMEVAESEQLFHHNEHLSSLGFIPEQKSQFNPDGLAIGLARDIDANGNQWVGLTCAACHTGQVMIDGRAVRIDGGQSLINYSQFETALLAAMQATIQQPEKWQRFMARLRLQSKTVDEKATKVQLQERIDALQKRYAINATQVAYGHGRLDAFGQIFNAIAVEALKLPENARSPNAPTSFPVLWDASHLDVVQWNASAPNVEPGPLMQNATTALAVYGVVDVLGRDKTYSSSTQIRNLGYIQRKYYKLSSPKWPEDLAGALDKSLVEKGASIYKQHCLQCHTLVDSGDPTRKLSAVLVPAAEVGTDSLMVNNFSDGTVKTGELQGKHFVPFVGKTFQAEASRLDLVMHVAIGTLLNQPWNSLRALLDEFAVNNFNHADAKIAYYKARPLNGVWTSAPYLHNGSVPTVYDLLLPVEQRPADFFVGNRELDKVKVGNKTSEVLNASLFDTRLLGNSNKGHEYGTQLSEQERLALLEYIKSL